MFSKDFLGGVKFHSLSGKISESLLDSTGRLTRVCFPCLLEGWSIILKDHFYTTKTGFNYCFERMDV